MLFNEKYNNKRILITGNSGFKGVWLNQWLKKLGAITAGLSHKENINHESSSTDVFYLGDITDLKFVEHVVEEFKPDLIFHLAAQAIVKKSFEDPRQTFLTNAIGTQNILEACRLKSNQVAIIVATTDKVYKITDHRHSFRENDALGGKDPYSASKAAAELICIAYRESYFANTSISLATVRSGNVIGGGDYADHRLIPDMIRAAIENQKTQIRRPNSVRPWQHVLDALQGYLLLGEQLLSQKAEFNDAWNFGPSSKNAISVAEVCKIASLNWNKIQFEIHTPDDLFLETDFLQIDSSKAISQLNWTPIWNTETAIRKTIEWYRKYHEEKKSVLDCYFDDFENYFLDCKQNLTLKNGN